MLWLRIDRGPRDARAATGVTGSLLFAALSLILAASLGLVVLDVDAGMLEPSPQASLSATVDAGTDEITIEHEGGDALDSSRTRIVVKNETTTMAFDPTASGTTLSAGNSAIVDLSSVDGKNRIDWNPSRTGWEYSQSSAFTGFEPGDRLTITVIDAKTEKEIYAATVSAIGSAPGTSADTVSRLAGTADATTTKKVTFEIATTGTVTVEHFSIRTAGNLSTLSSVTAVGKEVKIKVDGPNGNADAPSGYPTDGTTFALNATGTLDSGGTAKVSVRKFPDKLDVFGFTDAGSADVSVTLVFADGSEKTFAFAADLA